MALWQLTTPGSRMLVAVVLLLIPTLDGRFVAIGFSLISLLVAALAVPRLFAMMRLCLNYQQLVRLRSVYN